MMQQFEVGLDESLVRRPELHQVALGGVLSQAFGKPRVNFLMLLNTLRRVQIHRDC